MTAGFQAYTDSGLVQIDGTTQNYALRQTIGVTTAAGDMNAGKANSGAMYTLRANIADVTVSAVQPLFAIYSPSAYATIIKCVNNGGNSWTVRLWSSAAVGLTLYVFDQSAAAAPAGAGYGLQVFDASGNLIADARQRLARVLDSQAGNINNAGAGWGQWNQVDTWTTSFSYAGVSKVGVACVGNAFLSAPTGGTNNGWYNMSGMQTVGNTIDFAYQYFQQGSVSHPGDVVCYGSAFDWRFIAIDLSNL
ncbi:hypothetical protein [Paraburkholderia sp. BCC1885]|uniref:hypothetical protein n=1 Tax=Paraburkholderia sp. BCC1885 TaxID=2562669 RepID=UPI0011822740|nr:hypothetical protein [Paraburkholderia sp. BCC1885]